MRLEIVALDLRCYCLIEAQPHCYAWDVIHRPSDEPSEEQPALVPFSDRTPTRSRQKSQ